jgi:hypothetical protein
MGKELAEGKVHALERQIALAKTFAEDVGAKYVELEDHLHALDQENEGLHQQVSTPPAPLSRGTTSYLVHVE